MPVEYGTIINKTDPSIVKKSGPVKAAVKLAIGLVYQDGANGWTNAPVDGSIPAKKLYFNPIELDNTGGAKGDKPGTFYGRNARLVGKSDGIIAIGAEAKASETATKNGQFQSLADPTNPGAAYAEAEADSLFNYVTKRVAGYLGHVGEFLTKDGLATATVDAETNAVFEMIGGYA